MEVQFGMKLTDMSLIFGVVFLCLAVVLDYRVNQINSIAKIQLDYNQRMDNSLEAAMDKLVEVDNGIRVKINKEEAVQNFFHNLSIHFQVTENQVMIHKLKEHVPVIAIILEDGFYLYYNQEVVENGVKKIQKTFTPKLLYEWSANQYQYFFTLSDYIRAHNMETGERYQGRYQDIIIDGKVELLDEVFKDIEEFHRIRRTIIIHILQENIESYLNRYNRIALHYGIEYNFFLPTIEEEDWYRTIDDISMIAFFQGYPYGTNITGIYNYYAIAGARIHK